MSTMPECKGFPGKQIPLPIHRCFWRSIRGRLIMMMLAVSVVTAAVGYSLFVYWSMNTQNERLMGFSQSLVEVLSQDFARVVMLGDFSVAADVSARLDSFPAIRRVVLFDPQKSALYRYQRSDLGETVLPSVEFDSDRATVLEGSKMHFYLPLDYAGRSLGMVYLQLEADSFWVLLSRDLKALLLIAAMTLLFSFFLATRFEARFNAPILKLIAFLEKIAKGGSIASRIHTRETNEFGTLYTEVNRMLERVESSQEALRIAAVAFETPNGMVITDAKQRILQVNSAFTAITGYSAEEAKGQTPALLQSGRHEKSFYAAMWQSLQEHQYWEGEIYNRQKSGEVYPERLTIQAVVDETGAVRYYVGSFVDLTSLKNAEAKAEYLGLYDPLTGLANRQHLTHYLQEMLSDQEGRQGALLCFDLDSFKLINDSFGHDKGDELLVEVARRMRSEFGQNAFLARLGTDLFALVRTFEDREQLPLLAEADSERLLSAVETPYLLGDNLLGTKSRVGVALFGLTDNDAPALIKQADLALHQATTLKGQQVRFFDPEAEDAARHYIHTCMALQQALEADELILFYQTQVDQNAQVVGAEALLRWRHPQLGLLSPDYFIPVAERSHLIVPIGSWVLQKACIQLALWQQEGFAKEWTLSVNVSAQQFLQPGFVQEVQALIEQHAIRPDRLKLELTESVLVDDIDTAIVTMSGLRQLGLEVSLDDFGTGYASLSYLSRLPLSQIKIDRTFVDKLLVDKSNAAIVQSVLSLGEAFELSVVAEGVETKEQHDRLTQMGCRLFQGYYFSRPIPADQLAA